MPAQDRSLFYFTVSLEEPEPSSEDVPAERRVETVSRKQPKVKFENQVDAIVEPTDRKNGVTGMPNLKDNAKSDSSQSERFS